MDLASVVVPDDEGGDGTGCDDDLDTKAALGHRVNLVT
jgi:hypothetical protein